MKTKIIAHRGASALAKRENTIEAFQIAIAMKADMVEFDVRKTKDNVLIVFHDSTFMDVPISWQDYSVLQKEAAAQGFRIPTFEEVIKVCSGKIKMDIELKETGIEKNVIRILRKNCAYNEYTIKSFYDSVPYNIKRMDPCITVGLLVGKEKNDLKGRMGELFPVKRLRRCRADFISPYYKFISKLYVSHLHENGYPVMPWTVNDEKTMRKLISCNVDAIISDRIDVLKEVVSSY